jgi:hypothetical protein
MTEVLGMVHTHGRGLIRGRCWPASLKLVFDEMVAPVLDIMHTPSILLPHTSKNKLYVQN